MSCRVPLRTSVKTLSCFKNIAEIFYVTLYLTTKSFKVRCFTEHILYTHESETIAVVGRYS